MLIGLIVWSAVSLAIFGIAFHAWRSKTAVGFYSGVKPPDVTDVRGYNHAVALLWIIYGALFEALGALITAPGQPLALRLVLIPAIAPLTIALIVAYERVLKKYRK